MGFAGLNITYPCKQAGEGVHSEQVADLVTRLAAIGDCGDDSFEVVCSTGAWISPTLVSGWMQRKMVVPSLGGT